MKDENIEKLRSAFEKLSCSSSMPRSDVYEVFGNESYPKWDLSIPYERSMLLKDLRALINSLEQVQLLQLIMYIVEDDK